jgi:hypothetical protein
MTGRIVPRYVIGDLLGCCGRDAPASSTALTTPALIDLEQAFE